MKEAKAEKQASITRVLWSGRAAIAATLAGAVVLVLTFLIFTLL
jgi:hypothetical protein